MTQQSKTIVIQCKDGITRMFFNHPKIKGIYIRGQHKDGSWGGAMPYSTFDKTKYLNNHMIAQIENVLKKQRGRKS
jgi:hypothetical protein